MAEDRNGIPEGYELVTPADGKQIEKTLSTYVVNQYLEKASKLNWTQNATLFSQAKQLLSALKRISEKSPENIKKAIKIEDGKASLDLGKGLSAHGHVDKDGGILCTTLCIKIDKDTTVEFVSPNPLLLHNGQMVMLKKTGQTAEQESAKTADQKGNGGSGKTETGGDNEKTDPPAGKNAEGNFFTNNPISLALGAAALIGAGLFTKIGWLGGAALGLAAFVTVSAIGLDGKNGLIRSLFKGKEEPDTEKPSDTPAKQQDIKKDAPDEKAAIEKADKEWVFTPRMNEGKLLQRQRIALDEDGKPTKSLDAIRTVIMGQYAGEGEKRVFELKGIAVGESPGSFDREDLKGIRSALFQDTKITLPVKPDGSINMKSEPVKDALKKAEGYIEKESPAETKAAKLAEEFKQGKFASLPVGGNTALPQERRSTNDITYS